MADDRTIATLHLPVEVDVFLDFSRVVTKHFPDAVLGDASGDKVAVFAHPKAEVQA